MAPHSKFRFRPSLLLSVFVALSCAKADTLTVKPTTPGDAELVPSPRLEEFAYKKILLLPFEGKVEVKDLSAAALKEKDGAYYTGKLEKALLARGFEVISPEIVARVAKSTKGAGKLSAAEKAMVMGKETKADAVFVTQSIALESQADFYAVDELETAKVEAAKVKQDEKSQEYYQPETKDCVYRLPYYVVRMEGKLVDAKTGNVLWVGSGQQTAIDSLSESYVAKLGKKCELLEENFVFTDTLAGEPQLAATFGGLVDRLFDPLKTVAQKGKPIPVDKPKVKAPPPPKKEEPKVEEPKAKTAVVSKKKASIRSGPGKRNERLRFVSRKTKVEILETMGEWSKVKLQDGTVGWMHESSIIVNE
ncbi:MAG: SH3 domain-containing protein [Myxococcota bacterium]